MSIVKLNNRSVKDVTAFGSISSLGSLTHIATQTASSSASISFTSGIDSTYKEYIFYFISMHPASNNPVLSFNMSTDGGSNYNVTKTTSFFNAEIGETDSGGNTVTFAYQNSRDLAQQTDFATLSRQCGNDSDHSCSGFLHLFDPSNSTHVKHFICTTNSIFNYSPDYLMNNYSAGYGNTTSAVNAIQFKMSSGNIDSGQILLFGIN